MAPETEVTRASSVECQLRLTGSWAVASSTSQRTYDTTGCECLPAEAPERSVDAKRLVICSRCMQVRHTQHGQLCHVVVLPARPGRCGAHAAVASTTQVRAFGTTPLVFAGFGYESVRQGHITGGAG
ncbi:hypothetical protein IF2G_10843 [Cordyceps javanica]|nr:hypothetical protein IF2G_10843 [Cordyceps javanica]